MKIELKNTDFKELYEMLCEVFINHSGFTVANDNYSDHSKEFDKIREIIKNELKPQYEKAFLKYQNEKQEFNVGEEVKFRFYTKKWGRDLHNLVKIENNDWYDGSINKVSRLANGKYRYVIKYKDDATDTDLPSDEYGETNFYTHPMTEKNIRKI